MTIYHTSQALKLLTSGLIPAGWNIDGLALLAPGNGCGDIDNFVKLKQATVANLTLTNDS